MKGRYGWDYAASPQRLTEAADPHRLRLPEGPAVRGRPRRRAAARTTTAAGAAAATAAAVAAVTDGQKLGRDGRRKPGGLVDYDEVMPHFREATWDEALDLIARRLKEIHAERRAGRDRRVRVGEVLQRGGLPLPEADPHRVRHQQRRPLHPAVPRVVGRGAVRGRRLRRGVHDLRRRRQRRRRDHHRLQPDGEPPGGQLVLQAGPPPRHEDHLRRPARQHGRRARRHTTASSSPAPTWRSTTRSCTR